MRLRVLVIVLAGSFAIEAPDARAVDVRLGWDAATRWDSNVLRRSENEEDDFAIRVGPRVEIRKPQGDLTGRVRWATFWEGFLDTTGANNFEHFFDLRSAWQIDARNQLRLSNNLADTDSITAQQVVEDGVIVSPGVGVDVGTRSVLRNQANATFSHRLSEITSLQASVDNSFLDFEDDERSDAVSTRGAAQITRALSSRTVVGVGAAFTRQDFDDTPSRNGSGADIAEVFGIWNYQITPTLLMSTSLGPALNRPDDLEATRLAPETPTLGSFLVDAASCPQRGDGTRVFTSGCQVAIGQDLATNGPVAIALAPGRVPLIEAAFVSGSPESDDSLTLFGAWSLVKQWERSSAQLRFQRRTSAATGTGTSTDLTLASASFNWRPKRQWEFVGIAAWSLQTSASDVPITELVVSPATLFVDANGVVVDDPSLAAFRADGAAVTAGVRSAGSTDNAVETNSYQLQLLATREINRRLEARARLSFFRYETSGDLQADRTTDSIRFEVGLRYEFDPLDL